MSVTGSFVLESNENYDAWLVAVGIPAEIADKMSVAKPKLEVTKTANDITVKTISGAKEFSNTISFGKESPADVAGVKYSLLVNQTDNGYSGTITQGSKSGNVVVVVSDAGFTQTTTVEGVTAKRIYKRL